MPRSLRVRQDCIERVKQSVTRNGYPSQRALAEDIDVALATVGSFLRGKPVDRAIFVELCDKLSLVCEEVADLGRAPVPSRVNSSPSPLLPHSPSYASQGQTTLSWGEAADVSTFYGREQELSTLTQWQLSQLIDYLQTRRCLLILDNAESILISEERAGAYRPGYEDYGQLLRWVAETRHQSCLVLTSREQPKGLATRAGTHLPVRSWRVTGLQHPESQAILAEKGFAISADDGAALM